MEVRDVTADCDVCGEWNLCFVSAAKKRIVAMLWNARQQGTTGSFAETNLVLCTVACSAVKQLRSLFRAAKNSLRQRRVHVFGSKTNHCDLRIMDQHRSISRNPRHVPALHQIDDDRRQTGFDHMPTDPPNDRLLQSTRPLDPRRNLSQRLHRQHIRQTVEEIIQSRLATQRPRKILKTNFALT